MQSAKRYGQLALAGVAAAALVTGCGSSAGKGSAAVQPSGGATAGGSPQSLLAASVEKTVQAGNGKLHIDFKGSFGGQDVSFGGDGIADYADKKFELTLNLPAATGISGTIEERVIGSTVYVMLPSAATAATGGKPWIEVDAASLDSSSSSGLGSLTQDPTQFLNALKTVSSSVTTVGTEDIRGVKTTHYRAQIDLTKAAAASGADASALDQYKKVLGSATLPEDVYLDDSGLPRRVAVSLTPAAGSSGAANVGAFSVTVDLYDFGQADTSSIVAPPASEIGSLPGGIGG